MKPHLWLALLFTVVLSVVAVAVEKITTLQIAGQRYTGIREVKLAADGRLLILCDAPKTNITRIASTATNATASARPATSALQRILVADESLPDAFLQSWSISRQQARALRQQQSKDDLSKAISSGLFRQVKGVVYDLRKPQSNWIHFNNIKVLQSFRDPAMLNATPDIAGPPTLIFVHHLPKLPPGQNRISFTAMATTAPSTNGVKTMPRLYDCGVPCSRADIPDAMLRENRASMPVNSR
jgi:cell division protein FtsL